MPRRRLLVFRRFVRLTALILALSGELAAAAPQRPTDDAFVLAIVPAGRPGGSPDLRSAKTDLARNPTDLGLAVRVARLAIEAGRASADPRRYGQAQAALAPWWNEANPPEEARVLRAVIRQALHDFQGALADLDAILNQNPGNPQARLTRAFVRLVVGDAAGAAADCRDLPRAIGPLPAAVCRARVEALTGAAREGYVSLAGALDSDSRPDDTTRRFALAVLADIAVGLGRSRDADLFFADAAALGAADVPSLAGAADHLLETGRPAEVLKLLDGKGEADVLMLRRAIAAKRVGDARLAGWAAVLNERFAAAKASGVRLHLREEARFRLEIEGDAKGALSLALENWKVQKELADARLVLESAIAAGEPAAAEDVVGFIGGTGLVDVRVTPLLKRFEKKSS